MSRFRTILPQKEIQSPDSAISYNSLIGLMGSCFTENTADKFHYYAFPVWENPHGIIFHPFAMERTLKRIIHKEYYHPQEMIQSGELYYSFDHHSVFNAGSPGELVKLINRRLDRAHRQLKETTHLFLTLGTAFVYKHLERDIYVANCHKIPQKAFVKELAGVRELSQSILNLLQSLYEFNPELNVVLTVSPVRHLRDGMSANARSKAHLISAVHTSIEQTPAIYFPSYELIMDDLRDYRFYTSDMVHPSQEAVDYIFDYLMQNYISAAARNIMKEVESIRRDMLHRPFHPDSESHAKFLNNLEKKKRKFFESTGISLDMEDNKQ